MINRLKHRINEVDFVPSNKGEFTLNATFADGFGEWENDFTSGSNVVLPQEGYLELIRHLDFVGVQQMPTYNIEIDSKDNAFFVDLSQNVKIAGSLAEVTIQNYYSKDNIKSLIENTTFEYLKQAGFITDSDMVKLPYIVVPQDIGTKILGISSMVFVIVKEVISRTERITTRIADLIAGTVPSVGLGVVYPTGSLVRYGLLIAMDIGILVALTIAMRELIKQAFELLLSPVRTFKAMTVDRLLTIALAKHNCTYQSSLKSEWKMATVLPVPIDFQKKKAFQLLLNQDDRILNRGYPTASDSVSNAGLLIDELCKMYNIQPRMKNNVLVLEPKVYSQGLPKVTLDNNFNAQEIKENEMVIDTSKLWNTKILSYKNDATDKLLFDNPKGLRVEYKSIPTVGNADELTIIKGFEEIRINFSLATIKEDTKLEEFLMKLAKVSDKLLKTSFTAKLNARNGVIAISSEQFVNTKLVYQKGGKQTKDYVLKIGAAALFNNYHRIDDSKNNLYLKFASMPVRMNNAQFLKLLENNLVTLEGKEVEVTDVQYTPESSTATIDYKVQQLEWAKNIKSYKLYEE